MRYRLLTVAAVAAVLGATSVAAAGPGGTENIMFKSRSDSVSASAFDVTTQVQAYLFVNCWDDIVTGNSQGEVTVWVVDFATSTTVLSMYCAGEAFANAVRVTGNGGAIVTATLDPTAPECTGFAPAPVVLSLTAKPDGMFSSSSSGTETTTDPTGTYRYKNQTSSYSAIFTGAFPEGFDSLDGVANQWRRFNKERAR